MNQMKILSLATYYIMLYYIVYYISLQGGYTKVTDILPLSIQKELKIEGFLVGRWKAQWVEGIKAMAGWVGSGQIKAEWSTLSLV